MAQFNLSRRQFVAWSAAASASIKLSWAGEHAGPAPMLQKQIPSSGEKIPAIGIGTNRWISDGPAEETALLRQTLQDFFALGGRVIDTAPAYRSSETAIGNINKELGINDAFFLATKIDRQSPEDARIQLGESLEFLQTGQLDLLQVHNLGGASDLLKTMFEWRDEKLVRYVGITTSRISQFAEMEALMQDFPLDFVQLNYSLLERDAEERLLPLASERNIAVLVNRPFARGKLFQKTKRKPLPEWAKESGCESWAQYGLKFVLSHPAVTCAIPGMSKPDHVADNLNAGRGWLPDATQRQQQADDFERLV
jgi:aryl-alcohol dehydrogenase-like predicted oxidoreductase